MPSFRLRQRKQNQKSAAEPATENPVKAMRVNGFLLFTAGAVLVIALLSGCAAWNAERTAPMLGQRVSVNGAGMHVLDIGPRESSHSPVVLIHGASVNLRDMKIALGDALSEDRRVIMIDRPGRGYSERPRDGHRIAVQARYIRDALSELGVENPVVVGQSLGGAVALAYALQYQEDMAGLVLLAPVSHEWPGGVAWYNNASQIPVFGFFLRRLVIPAYGQFAAAGGVEASFAPDAAPENYAERSGLALLFRAKDFKSNAADLALLKPQIIEQQTRYGELDLPVAILAGTEDRTVFPRIHSRALERDIADATLTMLPDTGHALHHAETETILGVIRSLGGPHIGDRGGGA